MTHAVREPAVPDLPALRTEVPGPESRRIFAAEQALQGAGASAASAWSRLSIVKGRGAIVVDADGNRLLDACSGSVVMSVGHGDERIARALYDQARRLAHFYDFASEVRVRFLRALKATLPDQFTAFHLTNSGAEAVEAALRIVRSATGRHEIIAFHNGFHGRTLGALSLTGGAPRAGLGPLLPGVLHVPSPYEYRWSLGAGRDEHVAACAAAFDRAAEQVLTGRPAAVVIEPLQGAGGMIPIPAEFLQHLRGFCDRTGAVLVFDEILTGAGRTGTMWAFEQSGVVPDLLLAGKGVAGGFPIGIVAGRREVIDAGPSALPNHNSSTFGGGPLACAAGLCCLQTIAREHLVENAAEVGAHLQSSLAMRLGEQRYVGEVRGLGLAIGVELVSDRLSRTPISSKAAETVLVGLLRRGVVVSSGGHVLRLTPPLCLSKPQADFVVDALAAVLDELLLDT